MRFDDEIKKLGFIRNPKEPCVYKKLSGSSVVFLVLYVDDILLIGNDIPLLESVKSSLSKVFSMKDLGELHHFLGMQVQRTSCGLFLSQHQYMLDILDHAGMVDCKPCSTPVDINPKLSADGAPITDPTDFRSLVGALQYLTFTRPDIAYAMQQV